ncbi:ubiquitin interaction motif protein (macronuclear) [Tetrahymena thermophila SB210]|uniref:Ubiquitin interaction motif protein n=1 Tax=Tetrahymena thermophila (strain SB210) TaxID=312017 RepID=I7MFV2_TETTS|nr:ubiquitin interaction motif protein [Tetrahymena thermophila SB210]EAS00627.3 ubiquitin interaction motif protein [Tetrahymena thermophila SB210]|eukprot:XP_001020872.3 ubiquitin interaction motif protein [Tetrahymena thermophila SB210]
MQNIKYKIVNLAKIDWVIKDRIMSEHNCDLASSDSQEFTIKLNLVQQDTIQRIRIGNLNVPKVKIQLQAGTPQVKNVYERVFDLLQKDEFLKEDLDQLREKIFEIDCDQKVNFVIFTFSNPYYKEKSDILKFFYILLEKKGHGQYNIKLPEKTKPPNNIQNQISLNNFQPQPTTKKQLQLLQIDKPSEANRKTLKAPEGGGGYNSIMNIKNSPTSNKKEGTSYYQYSNSKQQRNHIIQEKSFDKLFKENKQQKSILDYQLTNNNNEDDDIQKAIEMSKKELDEQNRKKEEEKKLIQQLEKKDDSYDSIETQTIENESDNDHTYLNKKDDQVEIQNKNNVNKMNVEFKQSENKNIENESFEAQLQKAIELSKQEEEKKKKLEDQQMEEEIKKIKETSNSTQLMEEEEIKEVKQKQKDLTDEEIQSQKQQNYQKSEKKQNYLMKLSENKKVNINIQYNDDSLNGNQSFINSKEDKESNQNKAQNQKNQNHTNQNNHKNVMEEEIVKDDIENDQIDDKYKKYLQNRDFEDPENIDRKQNKHNIVDSVKKNNQNQNIWNENDTMEIESSNINHKSENIQETEKSNYNKYKPNPEKGLIQSKLFDKNKLNRQDNQEQENGIQNKQRVSININNKNNSNQQQSNNNSQLHSHFQLQPHHLSDRILKFQRQQELQRKIPEKYFLFQTTLKDILRDKIITISGFEGEIREKMKQTISELGGIYQQQLDELCSYMITKDTKTDKYNLYLKNKSILKHLKIVDKNFLNMCKFQKKLLNYQDYQIQ